MSDTSWYSIVDGISLMQGDVLMACPVSVIAGPWKLPLDPKETVFETKITSLLIMTQSCDLENDKTEFVLCATITDWATNVRTEINAGNTAIKSRDFRKKVIDGNIPGLSLLHKHESSPRLEWSVANFHRLYTLPKAFLQEYAQSVGPRLRLLSPYREHLAQAFARYFMRVGLPHDAKAFEKDGDVGG